VVPRRRRQPAPERVHQRRHLRKAGVDRLLLGLELGDRARLLGRKRRQGALLAPQVLARHARRDDEIGVGRRDAVHELHSLRKLCEGSGGQQRGERAGAAALVGDPRRHADPVL
jgi:hypothetical protein